jgi:hypothetical protein
MEMIVLGHLLGTEGVCLLNALIIMILLLSGEGTDIPWEELEVKFAWMYPEFTAPVNYYEAKTWQVEIRPSKYEVM